MTDQVVPESWYIPRALSNEALRLLTTLPMDEIERRLRMDGPAGHERPTDEQLDDLFVEIDGSGETQSWRAFARAVLARWGAADREAVELPPRPPLMEPPAHLALERYGVTWDGSSDRPLLTRMADGYWTPWHVAADLLERQAAAAPVARLPEDAQVIEPANRTILAPVPAPIPVSERLPGPSVKVLAHYLNGLGKGRTICAIWVPAKTRSDSYGDDDFTEYDEASDTFYWPEGWYEAIENWDDLGYIKVDEGEVLYWQPLPKWPAHALPLPEVK